MERDAAAAVPLLPGHDVALHTCSAVRRRAAARPDVAHARRAAAPLALRDLQLAAPLQGTYFAQSNPYRGLVDSRIVRPDRPGLVACRLYWRRRGEQRVWWSCSTTCSPRRATWSPSRRSSRPSLNASCRCAHPSKASLPTLTDPNPCSNSLIYSNT